MTLFSWKQTLRELFKTTIIGGASFLLPVAIVIFILSYALRLVRELPNPFRTACISIIWSARVLERSRSYRLRCWS